MASQVSVIGPAARRHVVKTTPGTYLSDVLEQACTKMRLDPTQYGMKHNSKTVDLSRTMRLSGLSSGAKLELTLLSRSPAVVSVALQLPSGTRLLDKFPSTTTLWILLRKFESGVAGGGAKDNFTARGIPKTSGSSGAGRLYHEMPVLHIMGRDYTTFTDLQKSLGQIGFNDGSVLLKLTFQATETPLEEAMEQTDKYFRSLGGEPLETEGAAGPASASPTPHSPTGSSQQTKAQEEFAGKTSAAVSGTESETSNPNFVSTSSSSAHDNNDSTTTIANRPTSIYRPSTSSTPQAAQVAHNPADYVPTVEHAKLHQAGLMKAGQNTRLLTDAELETQASERAARRATIDNVTIKVRFPDESSAVAPFGATDTAADLYEHVEGLLRSGASEPFDVAYVSKQGKVVPLLRDQRKLIAQVGLEGKVLVQVRWAEGASKEARRGPSLRKEIAGLGKEMEIAAIPKVDDSEIDVKALKKTNVTREEGKEKGKGSMPKWFKMGKK